MNNFIIISLAFILLLFMQTSCVNAQTVDFSVDEAVLEQLGKLKNKKFSKDDICIKRLEESSEIIVIGFFRNDYGCHFEGAFVNSIYLEDAVDLSKKALAALGWQKWNRDMRQKMLLFWVEKVLLSFSDVLYAPDKTIGSGNFYAPRVATSDKGETSIQLWTSVMRRKKEFYRHEFRFEENGNLLETKVW